MSATCIFWIMISSVCGFFVGASTAALFAINGLGRAEDEQGDEYPELAAQYPDLAKFLRKQAE